MSGYNSGDIHYCDQTADPLDTPSFSFHTPSPDWKGAGWYRIGNNKSILTQVVYNNHCNTNIPGYLARGSQLPEEESKTTPGKICFNHGADPCYEEMQIQIKKCRGFHLYKLEDVSFCDTRICTT